MQGGWKYPVEETANVEIDDMLLFKSLDHMPMSKPDKKRRTGLTTDHRKNRGEQMCYEEG